MTIYIPGKLILNNGLRPQAIAGVAPTLDYRFARDKRETEAVSLTDKLTFTGGNQGTFVGSDGYIQRATTNVPRFDHDPVSLVSEGLLVEGSRQNLLLRSEEFDNASWLKLNSVTVAANATVAPAGTATADKIIEPALTLDKPVVQSLTVAANTTHTASIYVKAAERPTILFHVRKSDYSTRFGGFFNISTGAFTAENASGGVLSAYSFTPVGNGWYRCSITGSIGANTAAVVTVYIANSSNLITYTGDGTSGIYLWGAQLEVGSTPSTYIPTTTTAVTRTADSAVIDGTGVLTGTYTMVAKPEGSAQVSGSTIVLQPGYTAERVMVFPAALSAAQITAIRSAM